ncbi:MAG: NADH-quinone oxidoreductase subunit J [Phycisphaerae bacterium]|nr:NADH-quinone oxidoreductase subunit J [Phycisphaerae bacterium]
MDVLAFYIFAALVLGSALGIVVSKNIVRTAVCLLGALGGVGCLYFLLDANLLAAIQLIVYAGGTLILIVFGVMLTSQSPWVGFKPTRSQTVGAVIVALLLALGLITLTTTADWNVSSTAPLAASPTVAEVGHSLLTTYLAPFEVASVLLLVVMIGAAYLARSEK